MGVRTNALISLKSHTTKIILRVIMNRLKKKIQSEVSWSQFGFKKNKGTRNAIFVMRILAETAIEMQKNLYVILIDYEKAFDRMVNSVIGLISSEESVKDVSYLQIYFPAELIMRKMSNIAKFKVNGQSLFDIGNADDSVLISDDEEDLQQMSKKRILRCYVWSVLLNGNETWTINKDMKKKLESMEMWCCRRMMELPWTDMAKLMDQELEVDREKCIGMIWLWQQTTSGKESFFISLKTELGSKS
ncbi:uncharacterized protein LOC125039300 [Penaeus chinensis]|uniref:uncharacterized protein LOC125039300 n=1 Tax=Penaeus chinensis TaxID=139456 RepID=UPI001FB66AA7|nr:uncharacterized protein LOC125039300 [Penaeus chinensis]